MRNKLREQKARRECAVELVRTSSLQELKLHSQRPGRGVHFSYRELMVRIGRVREDGHTAELLMLPHLRVYVPPQLGRSP
jgi:hypothetical protein